MMYGRVPVKLEFRYLWKWNKISYLWSWRTHLQSQPKMNCYAQRSEWREEYFNRSSCDPVFQRFQVQVILDVWFMKQYNVFKTVHMPSIQLLRVKSIYIQLVAWHKFSYENIFCEATLGLVYTNFKFLFTVYVALLINLQLYCQQDSVIDLLN